MFEVTHCRGCDAEIRYEKLQFGSLLVGTPGYCDPCLAKTTAKERERNKLEELEARRHLSHLPAYLSGLPLPDNEFGVIARQWAHEQLPKKGLCLTGPVGVGKTYLAAAACWERLHRKSCLWIPTARILTQLRGRFAASRDAALLATTGRRAAVLDDLDKVNPTDYGREVIFTAIDGRVEVNEPLLVTTNLGLDEIEQKLGPAIASRLVGHCEVVRMSGPDLRAL